MVAPEAPAIGNPMPDPASRDEGPKQMTVRRIVPDFATDRLAESRDFYESVLGMQVAMDLGWIVTLKSPDADLAQISFLTRDATAPVVPDLTVEVEDVDAVYATAQQRGEEIVYPLTDEPWGVRRFFVEDPDGTVVNVMSHRQTPQDSEADAGPA